MADYAIQIVVLRRSVRVLLRIAKNDRGCFQDQWLLARQRPTTRVLVMLNQATRSQSKVHRGEAGRAMMLTRAADGSANLTARHHSRHDRGNYPFPGDTAISSGSCQLDSWMLRPDAKSAFVCYLQYDIDPEHRFDVGLFVTQGDAGGIYYRQSGTNVASTATMPVGKWQRLTMTVDLERRVYSAEITGDGEDETPRVICRDVAYAANFNAFNMLEFSPQGATGSELFLDDLSLRWTPSVMFAPPGERLLARDGFESPTLSEQWTHEDATAGDITADSDISFGREYRSLRIRGSGV